VDEAARAQVVLHVHPGIHDEAAACERPIEGGLTAVASQARIGSHLDRFPGEVYQTPMRSHATVMHTVMSLQFQRCRGRAATLEIFGRSDYDSVVVDQLPHDQLRILRRPDPYDDIYSLFNQVDQPIRQLEVD
jgi:hypothetical protein